MMPESVLGDVVWRSSAVMLVRDVWKFCRQRSAGTLCVVCWCATFKWRGEV